MTDSQPKQYMMSIFYDILKVFYVINHKILLAKLKLFWIQGNSQKMVIRLFDKTLLSLLKRKFIIECGVPQGSILGPLLYLIYVSDIPRAANASILSFADDTLLLLSNQDIHRLYTNANTEGNKLYKWFCSNRLSLNANKTKYTILRSNNQRFNNNEHLLQIDGVKLSQIGRHHNETSTKFLGSSLMISRTGQII